MNAWAISINDDKNNRLVKFEGSDTCVLITMVVDDKEVQVNVDDKSDIASLTTFFNIAQQKINGPVQKRG